jgi:radical SAM superfamily enzyme YgiQ (UPF0313 family)
MKRLNVMMVDLKSDLFSPPYQFGLLVAYAMKEPEVANNIKFTFSNHAQKQPVESVAEAILAAAPDLVAMSSYSWNYKKMGQLFDLLSQSEAPLPWIVLGGPNCAGRFGDKMMQQHPIISALVEGEGEPAFRDICASLVDTPMRNPFLGARNCRTKDEAGNLVQPNMGHRLMALDDVPSPYLTSLLPVTPPPVFYETNRGCPYRCAFCYWGNGNAKIYRMSHERIREEMTFFAKNGVSSFILADANFGIFESDEEVAEIMAELNAKFNYPFKFLSVNYAKGSNDRVLTLASILRKGKIQTATTLALQSITPEAEKQSKRYAIKSANFVNLVRSAYDKAVPTYTDLILGMPGESIDEFIDGLETAISTGVPAIKIHQLSLLPGTEFYDKQEQFGLVLMSEVGPPAGPAEQRSEFWDFLVHSHPKMHHEDLKRGLRMIGVNHLLHNHNLGTIVNFYLARYGVTPRQVYEYFETLLVGKSQKDFPADARPFLDRARDLILAFSEAGIDAYTFEGNLSVLVWFGGERINSQAYEPHVRCFMERFYQLFCHHLGICQTPREQAILKEMIHYNMLVAPKPHWTPAPAYDFQYDVHAIWQDMLARILTPTETQGNDKAGWRTLPREVTRRLRELLTDLYLEQRRGPVSYQVENPFPILPSKLKVAWAVTNYAWFCQVCRIES